MISVIGAGPSGSYAAYLLAKNGFKANVYEEHNKIGKPVQCTGLITSALDGICKIDDECILNKIKNARIIAPNNKELALRLDKGNYVVDRFKFDMFFHDLALSEGVNYNLNHKLLDFKIKDDVELVFDKKRLSTNILVGADGVNSIVNRDKLKFVIGKQARFNGKFERDTFTVFLGYGGFSWVVPEDEKTARIGVIGKNVNDDYERLVKKLEKENKLKFLEWQSGIIPEYNPRITSQVEDKVYLIGDAAGMVKATTYGGLIYGLMAARELSRAIKEEKNYEALWRKRFGKELYLSLWIRKFLDKMSFDDYNKLVDIFSAEKNKNILEEHDRDFPSRFLLKLILREPRLLQFLKLMF